jgi:hypothetical protein
MQDGLLFGVGGDAVRCAARSILRCCERLTKYFDAGREICLSERIFM